MLDATSLTKLLEQLKRHEGCRRDSAGRHLCYHGPTGKLTVGYGHDLDAWPVNGITADSCLSEEEATDLLRQDVNLAMKQVASRLPWAKELESPRLAVLLNMAFHIGIRTLLTFKNTLKAVQNGEYAEAAEGMLASKWAKQTGKRAEELARQMRSGQWV